MRCINDNGCKSSGEVQRGTLLMLQSVKLNLRIAGNSTAHHYQHKAVPAQPHQPTGKASPTLQIAAMRYIRPCVGAGLYARQRAALHNPRRKNRPPLLKRLPLSSLTSTGARQILVGGRLAVAGLAQTRSAGNRYASIAKESHLSSRASPRHLRIATARHQQDNLITCNQLYKALFCSLSNLIHKTEMLDSVHACAKNKSATKLVKLL